MFIIIMILGYISLGDLVRSADVVVITSNVTRSSFVRSRITAKLGPGRFVFVFMTQLKSTSEKTCLFLYF